MERRTFQLYKCFPLLGDPKRNILERETICDLHVRIHGSELEERIQQIEGL